MHLSIIQLDICTKNCLIIHNKKKKKTINPRQNLVDFSRVRAYRDYDDIPVEYTKKSFEKSFIDYQGPNYFNYMPIPYRKNIYCGSLNGKKVVYIS